MILLLVAFSLGATVWLEHPVVRLDGVAYYLWLVSLIQNHTIDIAAAAHQYARFISYQVFFDQRTGRYATQFAFGAPVLWSPFYAVALLLDGFPLFGLHARVAAYLAAQGSTFIHSLSVGVGTWVYATAAVVLAYLSARHFVGRWAAACATLAIFVGTPWFYYTAVEPSMSHGVATFVVALPVWLVVRSNLADPRVRASSTMKRGHADQQIPLYWLITGLTVGLAGTVRWQLILLAVPIGLLLIERARWRALVAFALGAAAIFVSVPLSWIYLFGSPSPTAVGTVTDWWPHGWEAVLFSPVHGLLLWSPIVALGLIGLALLFRDGARRASLALLLFVVLEVATCGVAGDPTAGASFGQRRLTALAPALVIGLAWLLQRAFRRGWMARLPVGVLTLACVLFAVALFLTYLGGQINDVTGSTGDAVGVWQALIRSGLAGGGW